MRIVCAKIAGLRRAGRRTDATLTPTNWRAGTKTYRVEVRTTGVPTYPVAVSAKLGGTGAQPTKSSEYAQVTQAGAQIVPGTQTHPYGGSQTHVP